MSDQKKKKLKVRLKEFKDDEIHKIDDKTFYINSYMIYNSDRKGFLCDCMDATINVGKQCKHIKKVQEHISKNAPVR